MRGSVELVRAAVCLEEKLEIIKMSPLLYQKRASCID